MLDGSQPQDSLFSTMKKLFLLAIWLLFDLSSEQPLSKDENSQEIDIGINQWTYENLTSL